MDIGACFTMQQDVELARFEQAADKTLAQRLSICLSPTHPSQATYQRETGQKYKKYVLVE